MWFAILWHGFTVELVSYWIEAIDNFWHAQSTFVFFGRREPMQIVLVYPSYLFIAAIVTERMGLSGEWMASDLESVIERLTNNAYSRANSSMYHGLTCRPNRLPL